MKKYGMILIGMLLAVGSIGLGIFMLGKEREVEEAAKVVNLENKIIPMPLSYKKNDGEFTLDKNTKIYIQAKDKKEIDELKKIGNLLNENLKSSSIEFQITVEKPKENYILLRTDKVNKELGNEGYNLVVNEKGVDINAYTIEGVFRGIQSFRQLLPVEIEDKSAINVNCIVPFLEVNDKPEYEYRGIMIDVARHFFSVDEIKRQIDVLSSYKINKLHLHLSDDQGFRLEIKKWPKLTEVGGKTSTGGGEGGYYTQEDFKEIVRYANERYIEVIPEFDMPGHTIAMLASYDFLNPNKVTPEVYTGMEVGISTLMCRDEKTYEFIEDIIKEVSEISPSKYIHIGGDESDSTPKEDYDYFVGRVSKIVQSYDKTAIGWDPIDTSPNIDNKTVLQNWKGSNKEGTKKEMKMIISIASKSYLDMKYDSMSPYGLTWAGYNPIKNAYNWDPTKYAEKDLILGVEAALFTETISNRTGLDYMIYPRILGYAEIGWTPQEMRDYKSYKERLEIHGERLKNMGILDFRNHAKY